ncbi:MAG: glycosyltransferase family 4 protein [Solirubrobacteraceae bacterium]|nr:glycosyltransferase family 4 protein [Solirubrobacteraceae bacterium]
MAGERGVRILLVSQMWPGPEDPDLGAFVAQVGRELQALGHDVDHAVLDRRGGGPLRHLVLLARVLRAPRPDVAFAHFLVPTGLSALLGTRAPLVVMAHGQDVANAERLAPVRAATRLVVRRAAGVIANSEYLAGRLEALTGVRAEVIDCGVDMAAFSPGHPPLPWPTDHEGPRFLCVGSLVERKNVVALADAFGRLGRGSLVFVGDGPLRSALQGRTNVHLAGRVPHAEVPGWIAACDVLCQPSLLEPFGQAALEAMAMERSVVATREGGPPEFVTPEAGVLADPRDVDDLVAALGRAAELPRPNHPARAAAGEHDAARQAVRRAAILARAAGNR